MAQSVVSICNVALSRIGILVPIASLDEDSAEAEACSLHYELVRDQLLEEIPWPFASEWLAELVLVEETPNVDWGYSFRLPGDFIAVRSIRTGAGRATDAVPFSTGLDDDGPLLYTDLAEDFEVEVTRRVEDAVRFSPSFASALAWGLAAEIAVPLAKSDAMRDRAAAMFREACSVAKAAALNAIRRDPPPDCEALQARL